MTFRGLALACFTAIAAPGCSNTESESAQDIGTHTAEATTATRIYASEGALDLSFETLGTFEERDGVRALVLRATANRYLQHVFSFVPDDAFGTSTIISERRFEVVLKEGYELNTVLSGLPLFITVNTFTGVPNQYTARIVVAPRFFDFRGASGIFVETDVNPVWASSGDNALVYRGYANAAASSFTVTAPDGIPQVTSAGAGRFVLDWRYPSVQQAMDPHTVPLVFDAALHGGGMARKTARLVARVTELALTSGDAYETWPSQPCLPSVHACITSQPQGASDFSACGTYRQVSRCMYAGVCEGGATTPLALTAIDSTVLEPERLQWNSTSTGMSWHHLEPVDAYSIPECPTEPKTIQSVMAKLGTQYPALSQPSEGSYIGRADLAQVLFFSPWRDGDALLAAMDVFAGGGEVQAWTTTYPISCHNCTDNKAWVVLFYPASGKVLVLEGNYGYDS
ncbi:hypothetical protein A176_000326 [Myxococcus hansupus]|uniref:Uncharacterized protein n=1 Tax=Pseudomyxococcus hansupus TaxID=1297742 RepID=A0A0H4WL04_9BACT|nr:hypothetical protein [Myxococcus hansupus]AKQ63414.1 hypothetical protein A176_000326 [Myxococcus hansupus]